MNIENPTTNSYEQGSACTRYPLTSSWYEEPHLASGVFHLYKYNKIWEKII